MPIDLTDQYGIDQRTYYLDIVKGNSYRISFNLTGLDFTNYIGQCHWQNKTWDDPTATVIINSDNNILPTSVNTTQKKATYSIRILSTETANLTLKSPIYGDLRLNNGSGEIITACRIRLQIRGGVTRD